ncbi:MAG: PP2C family protein-serine/threonine phosphatase, partial [Planctomycetota bacterium]
GPLGGDFFDFIQFDRDTLGILVADSSGKGLSGALLMVEARAVIRSIASVSTSPKRVLMAANRVLHRDLQRGSFITMFFAMLHLSSGVMKFASAGHTPMLLWRDAKRKCYAANPSGLVLGAADEKMFDKTLEEQKVELQHGDRVVLYTDGVTELMNGKEEEYGKKPLIRVVHQHEEKSCVDFLRALVQDLKRHQGRCAQSDDITVVTFRMMPEETIWPET